MPDLSHLRAVCVYCGSAVGLSPAHAQAAAALGRALAQGGTRLVYGGGRIGLMGVVADAALQAGGSVTGVIPAHLQRREVGHDGLDELIVVDSMHIRKQTMVERSDAFIVLAGGLGTLDETFEILTWRQLGLHGRPVILLNIEGFWDPLLALLDAQLAGGFLTEANRALLTAVSEVEAALGLLAAHRPDRTEPDSGRL